jgi:hypothetical protein
MSQSRKAIEKNQVFSTREGPVLRFTPTAWSKLLLFCHAGPTEIGGFGITSPNDLLLIEEFVTVRQKVSFASVEFDDVGVADFFEGQVEAGRRPEQFARIWLHTHPGDSPSPSGTDEQTFTRVFGHCDWAVMFILSRTGRTYVRLRFNAGPGGEVSLPVAVEFMHPFAGTDIPAWQAEYTAHIHPEDLRTMAGEGPAPCQTASEGPAVTASSPAATDNTLMSEFEALELTDRQIFLDELAERPELWAEEGGFSNVPF